MEVAFYKLNTKTLDSLKDTEISETNQKLILNFVNCFFLKGSASIGLLNICLRLR